MTNNVYIVMGVSASGKTTIGRQLAEKLGLPFYDADDFHSAANIAKMASGTPLTDADRQGWLADLATGIGKWEKAGGAVLACSALKEAYRQTLQGGAQLPLRWVFLDGSRELLRSRLLKRKNHYMGVTMLDSQLETLEKPTYGLRIPLEGQRPEQIVAEIVAAYAPSSTSSQP
ncbi:gluconokinase [Hymenobacter sp.]|jgi:carbohydrate kinase (thermoresistant glucokinase family)|uniref:gluconokinase n=1 Tax=Hymenobacter sp. TaxID=1898978 RepID=UPI002EDB0712